jgi:hypothetical protein
MIRAIEKHIRDRASDWGLEITHSSVLRPLIRSNPEHNGIVLLHGARDTELLSFWFTAGRPDPIVIAKAVTSAIGGQALLESITLQERANQALGYPLFPRVYEMARVAGRHVIFMECVNGPNYEILTARAVSGSERSPGAVNRVAKRYFEEIGVAIKGLRAIKLTEEEVDWAPVAARSVQEFCSHLGADIASVVKDKQVDRMLELIGSKRFSVQMVLTEGHAANYLPGLRAVDQFQPDMRSVCQDIPDFISAIGIAIGFFRASPIATAFSNYHWIDALGACVKGEPQMEIVGRPVRDLLRDLGLDPARPDIMWAFIMGFFFMRDARELEYHANNLFVIEKLRSEFRDSAERLMNISARLLSDVDTPSASSAIRIPSLNTTQLTGEYANRNDSSFLCASDFPVKSGDSGTKLHSGAIMRLRKGLGRLISQR